MTKYYFATVSQAEAKQGHSFTTMKEYSMTVEGLLKAIHEGTNLVVVLVREEEWSGTVVPVVTATETGMFCDGTSIPKNVLATLNAGMERARNGYWQIRGRRSSPRMLHNYHAACLAAKSLAAK